MTIVVAGPVTLPNFIEYLIDCKLLLVRLGYATLPYLILSSIIAYTFE